MDLARLRTEYSAKGLDEGDLPDDPLEGLRSWIFIALDAGLAEPNAFVLATVDGAGRPWTRHVLAKEIDDDGVVFYTNHTSNKGAELAGVPAAAATFAFLDLERQVNLAGEARRVGDEEADAYFAVRPRSAQIGAWASDQSTPLADRAELEARHAAAEARFVGDAPVPRPPHWGGYRLVPHTVEFWQGRPSRLHDRLRFERAADGGWAVSRLSP